MVSATASATRASSRRRYLGAGRRLTGHRTPAAAATGSNSAALGGSEGLPAPFPESERGRRAGACGEQRRPSAAASGQARRGEARGGEAARRRHRGRSQARRCRPRPGPPPAPPAAPGALRNAAPLPAPPDPVTRSPPPGRPPCRRGASGRRSRSREPLPTGSGRVSWDHRVSATTASQGQSGPGRGGGAAEPPGGGGVSRDAGEPVHPEPAELSPVLGSCGWPLAPCPAGKLSAPPLSSLNLLFCSAALAALSASCVTGFRLAARQRDCTSIPHVGKKFGAGSITLPGWLGAAAALPSPRPVSQPLTQSTALRRPPPPAHSQRRSSGLPRTRRGPKGCERSEGQAALCLAKALRDPRSPVPHPRASSSAHGVPCRRSSAGMDGPRRRTALQ
ncbi:uncharacterized protein [Taeniopygia guttata]|uniref:uncharacterized protein n=1 Tax=Taeniopygia guttata TaxID=59729 RepID=UPI003BB98921